MRQLKTPTLHRYPFYKKQKTNSNACIIFSLISLLIFEACQQPQSKKIKKISTVTTAPPKKSVTEKIATKDLFQLYPSYTRFLSRVPPEVISAFYFKGKTAEKIVSITFDDGPLHNTAALIDYLKQENIPAAFFLTAQNLTSTNSLYYSSSLFELGMHGYYHLDLRKRTTAQIQHDFNACDETATKYGLKIIYYRPPYGIINKETVVNCRKYNWKGVLWNIDSRDWDKYQGNQFIKNIQNGICPGSIILLHDGVPLSDLKAMVEFLKKENYTIVPLKKIIGFENRLPTQQPIQ